MNRPYNPEKVLFCIFLLKRWDFQITGATQRNYSRRGPLVGYGAKLASLLKMPAGEATAVQACPVNKVLDHAP
jgi:hypothetical protein